MSFTNPVSSNMDMRKTSSSISNTTQSMGTKDFCILVVHDDPMYRNIITDMLQNCNHYEVLKFQKMVDAFGALREKNERLSIIITDIHRSNSNGFEILQYIEKEFKLQVISMTPHQNTRVVSIGLDSSAKLYFLKSFSGNEFKSLWQQAYTKEKSKGTSFQNVSVLHENEVETTSGKAPPNREVNHHQEEDRKRKRVETKETDDLSEETKDDSPNEKKQRVVWTEWMHRKFLEAVQQLGHDKAFPKKIVELMNVPGLTRENVASHLQKYRMCLKRAQEDMQFSSPLYGMNTNPLGYCQSSYSGFSPSERALQYQTGSPLFTPYQQRSNTFNAPISISNLPCSTSTSTSNMWQQQQQQQQLLGLSSQQAYSLNSTMQNDTNRLEFETTTTTQANSTSSYVGFRLTDNGKSVECGQLRPQSNEDMTVKSIFEGQGNENDTSIQYQSTAIDNDLEQQFYVPPAACELDDLLNGTGVSSPQITFDFDDSLLGQNL